MALIPSSRKKKTPIAKTALLELKEQTPISSISNNNAISTSAVIDTGSVTALPTSVTQTPINNTASTVAANNPVQPITPSIQQQALLSVEEDPVGSTPVPFNDPQEPIAPTPVSSITALDNMQNRVNESRVRIPGVTDPVSENPNSFTLPEVTMDENGNWVYTGDRSGDLRDSAADGRVNPTNPNFVAGQDIVNNYEDYGLTEADINEAANAAGNDAQGTEDVVIRRDNEPPVEEEEEDAELSELAEKRLQREKELAAFEEELASKRAQILGDTEARAGLAGMGLSGATSALMGDTARQIDRSNILARQEFTNRQSEMDWRDMQRQIALYDLEDADGVDYDNDGFIGKPSDKNELNADTDGDGTPDAIVSAADAPDAKADQMFGPETNWIYVNNRGEQVGSDGANVYEVDQATVDYYVSNKLWTKVGESWGRQVYRDKQGNLYVI